MKNNIIDCRSEEGITIGLIDSIISIARVLKIRLNTGDYPPSKHIIEALKDLHNDEDLYTCLKIHVYNSRLMNPEDERMMIGIREAHKLLKEKGLINE